jgi:HAD superfamily hydrolase (TIGR01490 family)
MASENAPKVAFQAGTRLAVIDLDGTLLKGLNAERIFYLDLVVHGRVGALRMLGFLLSLVRDSVRLGFRKAIGSNARILKGQGPETVRRWAETFGRTYLRKAVPEALRTKILSLKAEGCRIVLLTGSLQMIADQLRDRLGAEVVIGTGLETEGGTLTGRKTGIFAYGPRKLDALNERIDPAGIDWPGSWALADSFSDRPVLELVGHPVAVHADRRLRRLARKRGWEIIGRR